MDDVSRRTGSSGRMNFWLPRLAAAVLAAGVAAMLVSFFHHRNATEPLSASTPGTPFEHAVGEKTVPLERAATRVARQFILTAVARRNLADAYDLVGAELKQGVTRAQWNAGNIPVVPYPVSPSQATPAKVAYSHKSSALLEVTLHPRASAQVNGVKVGPQTFYLELHARGSGTARHWVVTNWVPRGSLSIPQGG
jgi:hypothetical protein